MVNTISACRSHCDAVIVNIFFPFPHVSLHRILRNMSFYLYTRTPIESTNRSHTPGPQFAPPSPHRTRSLTPRFTQRRCCLQRFGCVTRALCNRFSFVPLPLCDLPPLTHNYQPKGWRGGHGRGGPPTNTCTRISLSEPYR